VKNPVFSIVIRAFNRAFVIRRALLGLMTVEAEVSEPESSDSL
jgi:hypothetical protein